ncbi:putative transcription factor WRKY family [Lupinus albus]|uniref:Putative transcription factor WRKY family n=1 Tax=Lupinus albus TaxID=3870 RepID=A0A6A4NEF3_LUPAL|nr:putative transcription factor WRKY family [Lupinus albus]
MLKPIYIECMVILCCHMNSGTKMTDKNERAADSSPDSDFTNQWCMVYDQANVVSAFGEGSGILFEGSSSTREISSVQQKKVREKFALKTKSEVEILDDGYKWRKYGKKMVKNSPNPRHYYRCSVEGCHVKKTVDRDRDDPRYVITTYGGTHTHPR